jgi:cell fate (sporulation/competence/biofilm development) regulator YlbF (YheA/YmcA/DUF963 family)
MFYVAIAKPSTKYERREKINVEVFQKNPAKGLRKQYDQLVEKAFQAQHNGHMRLYSELTVETEEVRSKLDAPKS